MKQRLWGRVAAAYRIRTRLAVEFSLVLSNSFPSFQTLSSPGQKEEIRQKQTKRAGKTSMNAAVLSTGRSPSRPPGG
jgi:hypothetical protein